MILVVSFPDDEHTVAVLQRLDRLGREVVSINLADFPASTGMALSWPEKGEPSYEIAGPSGPVDLARANVGWWRRVRPHTIDEAITDPADRAFAESETRQAVEGMLDALSCTWVNPRAADDAAHRKPYQWAVARQVGLPLPRTLVTTQPDAARQFIEELRPAKVVFKAFLASLEAWRETTVIEAEDLERLDSVRYAPVIFQEYIEGVDLRITHIGERLFAAQIDARQSSYPYDMRMVIGETGVQATELPAGVTDALLKLQKRLGLYYGAIDMRLTPDGRYVFLEVNPAGQWMFVEKFTGLPITEAMADFLVTFDEPY